MTHEMFTEFAFILGIAALIGFIGIRLKQPLIVSFIAVGIIVGPSVLDILHSTAKIELLAHLGISILLFVVGLKLDIHIIKSMGVVALITGLGQVFFTSVVGYIIALLLGMDHISALYVAVALTFSSTIIIVKLLSDKKELESLHGKIAIGFLIVQDIVVVLVMIALSTMGNPGEIGLGLQFAMVVLKGILMLVIVAILMKYVLPTLLKWMAKSSEMLLLFSISWAVLGAIGGYALGFSQEVGAFLAGITIASTSYRDMIAARLVSLRDFLLLFFFINLGASLELGLLGEQIIPAIIFSLFVLIGNPLIVMIILGMMGYRSRTGLLSGLTVAQISEFSLILAALGFSLGHISQEIVGLITLVGLITISASTYLILYSHELHIKLSPYLKIFERKNPFRELALDADKTMKHPDTIVVGLGRYGMIIAQTLEENGNKVLGVDFNPDLLKEVNTHNIAVKFGDIEDPEFITHLPLNEIKCFISTIRNEHIDKLLADSLKSLNYKGKLILSSNHKSQEDLLKSYGADLVLIPYSDAALEAVERINNIK